MSIPIFNCFKSKQQKPRNKIIVFANQKGGAGKTTNCVLFGNTLIEHQHPFVMIDGDPQRSIVKKHEQDHERFPDLQRKRLGITVFQPRLKVCTFARTNYYEYGKQRQVQESP